MLAVEESRRSRRAGCKRCSSAHFDRIRLGGRQSKVSFGVTINPEANAANANDGIVYVTTKQQDADVRGCKGFSRFVPCCLVETLLMNKSSVPHDSPLTRGSFCFPVKPAEVFMGDESQRRSRRPVTHFIAPHAAARPI